MFRRKEDIQRENRVEEAAWMIEMKKFSGSKQIFFFETLFRDIALVPVLELALVDQAGLKLTEICLTLPPECWD